MFIVRLLVLFNSLSPRPGSKNRISDHFKLAPLAHYLHSRHLRRLPLVRHHHHHLLLVLHHHHLLHHHQSLIHHHHLLLFLHHQSLLLHLFLLHHHHHLLLLLPHLSFHVYLCPQLPLHLQRQHGIKRFPSNGTLSKSSLDGSKDSGSSHQGGFGPLMIKIFSEIWWSSQHI
jgi:hypothetical protein